MRHSGSLHTGLCGPTGYLPPARWCAHQDAVTLARTLKALYEREQPRVLHNPHRQDRWALRIATAPAILGAVYAALGTPDAAIENTFAVIKWGRDDFEVPPHQDGIDSRIELNPQRSLSVWAAISEAPVEAGAVQVAAGSHAWGYLPFTATSPTRLSEDSLARLQGHRFTPVPLHPGEFFAFDSRLVHFSPPNTTALTRIGMNIRFALPNGFVRGCPEQRPGWMPLSASSFAETSAR